MITIDFRHIALFARDSKGVTVIFPAGRKHSVVVKGDIGPRPLRGLVVLDARDGNGVPLALGRTPLEDRQERLHSLSRILGHVTKKKALKAADLIADGVAQGAIRLSGGTLRAVRGIPVVKDDEPYMDADWTFGTGGKTRKLTNRVLYELPTESGVSYRLVFPDGSIELDRHARIEIANIDTGTKSRKAARRRRTSAGTRTRKVVLRDFVLLYSLLEGSVKGPAPETPEKITAKNPERPLCPVGEP